MCSSEATTAWLSSYTRVNTAGNSTEVAASIFKKGSIIGTFWYKIGGLSNISVPSGLVVLMSVKAVDFSRIVGLHNILIRAGVRG